MFAQNRIIFLVISTMFLVAVSLYSTTAAAQTIVLDDTPESCVSIGGRFSPTARFAGFSACFISSYHVTAGTTLEISAGVDLEMQGGMLTNDGVINNHGILFLSHGYSPAVLGTCSDPRPAIAGGQIVNNGSIVNFYWMINIRSGITNGVAGRIDNRESALLSVAGGNINNAGQFNNVMEARFLSGGGLEYGVGSVELNVHGAFDTHIQTGGPFPDDCLYSFPASARGTLTNQPGGVVNNSGVFYTETPDEGLIVNDSIFNNDFGFIHNAGSFNNAVGAELNHGRLVLLAPGGSMQSQSGGTVSNESALLVDVNAVLPDFAKIDTSGTFDNTGTINNICGGGTIIGTISGNAVVNACKTWTGLGGDENVSTTDNWNPPGVPGSQDNIFIALTTDVHVDTSLTVGPNRLMTINAGGSNLFSLFIEDGVTLTNQGTVENNGNIDNSGTLDNSGRFVNFFAQFTNQADGVIVNQAAGSLDNEFGFIENFGAIGNDGLMINNDGGLVDNVGQPPGPFSFIRVNPAAGIMNSGTLDNRGGAIDNFGTIDNDCGGVVLGMQPGEFSNVCVIDSDGDGVTDDIDNCPGIANPGQSNGDGDALGDVCDPYPNDPDNDVDGDGVSGEIDNCPSLANADQANADADAFGDVCDPFPSDPDNDADGDGVSGDVDNCPAVANPDQADSDADTVGDLCDNAPDDPNPGQEDGDNDGIGDVVDNCPSTPNFLQTDTDGDGIGDACDEVAFTIVAAGETLTISNNQVIENLIVEPGGLLVVDPGAILTITGILRNSGTIDNRGRIAYTPEIVFSLNDRVMAMTSDGRGRKTISNVSGSHPEWTPDASRIVFDSGQIQLFSRDIYVMDADGGNQVRLTSMATENDVEPTTASADGTPVAFERTRASQIFVRQTNGTETQLTTAGSNFYPNWSPDGTKIAFTSNRDGDQEIFVMNADGTNQVQLTTNSGFNDRQPSWSPDGQKIAFSSDRDHPFNTDLYIMNADGSSPTPVTSNNFDDEDMTWSPDGTRIVFRRGRSELKVINVDGTGEASLGSGQFPDWSPLTIVGGVQNRLENFALVLNSGVVEGGINVINSGAIENDCGGILPGDISGTPPVDVCDVEPPQISLPADTTVEHVAATLALDTSPTSTGTATATDNLDPNPAVTFSDVNTPGSSPHQFTISRTWRAQDASGNLAEGNQTIQVVDTTPPVLSLPADISADATSAAGAAVTFAATATDAADPSPAVFCTPASGSVFPIGENLVNCTATDATGNVANGDFTITVGDTTPPVLTLPPSQTVEANGPTGAIVSFVATASDDNDVVDPVVTCVPAPGSTFALGDTTVNCSAVDTAGNQAGGSFQITVEDTTAPVLALPPDQAHEATGPAGAVVNFLATAADLVDDPDPAVVCTPSSGSTFALGDSLVNCTTADVAGNLASGSFTITVGDKTPPILSLPADQTHEATGASGAIVNFSATAADAFDDPDPAVICAPSSGSTFGLGTTTVNCSTADTAGNSTNGSFDITVEDTTTPDLTLPPDQEFPATSAAGEIVNFLATATDTVDPSPVVICNPPSGSTFPVGSTLVQCSATDVAGNVGNGSFTIDIITPQTLITRLIAEIEALTDSGAIHSKDANSLIKKLDKVVIQLDKGRTNSACKQMSSFIKSVETHLKRGKLDPADAQDLITRAEDVKLAIGC